MVQGEGPLTLTTGSAGALTVSNGTSRGNPRRRNGRNVDGQRLRRLYSEADVEITVIDQDNHHIYQPGHHLHLTRPGRRSRFCAVEPLTGQCCDAAATVHLLDSAVSSTKRNAAGESGPDLCARTRSRTARGWAASRLPELSAMSAMAGERTIRTLTMATYQHVLPGMQAEAAKALPPSARTSYEFRAMSEAAVPTVLPNGTPGRTHRPRPTLWPIQVCDQALLVAGGGFEPPTFGL